MKPLTKKEQAKLKSLHRKIQRGKATMSEVQEAISLRHRDNKTA